jgi:hypothetical protein
MSSPARRVLRSFIFTAAVLTLLACLPIAAVAQPTNSSPHPTGPAFRVRGLPDLPHPRGMAENRWRYRRSQGRWWYWSSDNSWSFFNGDIWVPFTGQADLGRSEAGSLLGPISGNLEFQGVVVRGPRAGLAGPHDRATTQMLRRGTVLPKYLREETKIGTDAAREDQ